MIGRIVLPLSPKSTRRFCLAALLAAVLSLSTGAQVAERGWEWQNPKPQGNAISAIRFAGDKLHGWAVGADGLILYTTDGGFRWEHQPTRLVNALNGLYVFDRQHAFAVGARGLVITTRNAGEKWIEAKTPTKDHLNSITFAPDNPARGWAVGTYGCILATIDGGANWVTQKSPTQAHLYSVSFFNRYVGLAVGDRGTVVRTNDGGRHWKEVVRMGLLPFTG
ncbi:MAG TPA: YCF48-related protein, partial [Pyrinomonadaceae bacterium]|nr:YCF48-related protein [Pyrinomonadaceae bacterium]